MIARSLNHWLLPRNCDPFPACSRDSPAAIPLENAPSPLTVPHPSLPRVNFVGALFYFEWLLHIEQRNDVEGSSFDPSSIIIQAPAMHMVRMLFSLMPPSPGLQILSVGYRIACGPKGSTQVMGDAGKSLCMGFLVGFCTLRMPRCKMNDFPAGLGHISGETQLLLLLPPPCQLEPMLMQATRCCRS